MKDKINNEDKSEDVVIDEKKEILEEKQSKEAEYLELAQRIKAEFENYKKRNAELAQSSFQNGIVATVSKILPAIDSFVQAKSNIQDEKILSGIDLIYNQLIKGLNDIGVKKIEALGNVFDPNFHNAILADKKEEYPDQTILEEFQAGFTLGDKLIRPSVVKVNRLD